MEHLERIAQLEAELAELKAMSITWTVEDFEGHAENSLEYLQIRNPELTDWRQVYDETKFPDALHHMINNHDASLGITWDTIDYYLDEFCKKD